MKENSTSWNTTEYFCEEKYSSTCIRYVKNWQRIIKTMKKRKTALQKKNKRDVPQISKFVVNIELLLTKPIAPMEQTVPVSGVQTMSLASVTQQYFFLPINGHFIQCQLGHLSRQTSNISCVSQLYLNSAFHLLLTSLLLFMKSVAWALSQRKSHNLPSLALDEFLEKFNFCSDVNPRR